MTDSALLLLLINLCDFIFFKPNLFFKLNQKKIQPSLHQEMADGNIRLMKEKDEEIFDLRCQLNDARNFKMNNQELHDALIHDFKKTISVIRLKFF